MSYKFTEIFDKESANAYIVDTRINSIHSDMEILKMNAADVVDKIQSLFSRPEYFRHLSQDQVIALGATKERYLKLMKETDAEQKNI